MTSHPPILAGPTHAFAERHSYLSTGGRIPQWDYGPKMEQSGVGRSSYAKAMARLADRVSVRMGRAGSRLRELQENSSPKQISDAARSTSKKQSTREFLGLFHLV